MTNPLPPPALGNDVRCHWCDYIYRLRHDFACTRCHMPYDAEKAATAKIRNERTYLERLTELDRRKLTVSKKGYMFGKRDNLNKKLDEYLGKHGSDRKRKSYYPPLNKRKDRTE